MMHVMKDIGGVEMPEYFGSMAGESPSETAAKPQDGNGNPAVPPATVPAGAASIAGKKPEPPTKRG